MAHGAPNVPNLQARLQVFDLLDKLEAVTGAATKLPLTKRAVINPQEVQELVARLRHALPQDLIEAQQIIRYKDSFIQKAQAESKRMRETAEQEALHRISETQVMHEAQRQADELKAEARRRVEEMIARAEQQARDRIQGADAYAIDVLRRLEEELKTLLASAQRGLEVLQQGSHVEEGAPPLKPAPSKSGR